MAATLDFDRQCLSHLSYLTNSFQLPPSSASLADL